MNILTVESVSKTYGEKTLFDKISFGVNDRDKIGIIGVNGCGKSTLLKLIAGYVKPDEGQVVKNKSADLAYLAQNEVFDPADTILSYVTKGKISPNENWSVEGQAKAILKKLYITNYDTPIENLSGGEKKRVALARTLLFPAQILILDEPTNHLDNRMITWLEDYLKKFQGVLLMVTHDRYFLDRVTNKMIELDRGKLYTYEANYSGFLELKEQRMEQEAAAYHKSQNLLRSELEWVRRGAQARSTKQKARLERFEQLKNIKEPEEIKKVEMDSLSTRLGKKTIELRHLTKSYNDRVIINDFSYHTIRNERIGIVGENGCGKTTLLKLIMGLEQPDSGSVTIGETVKIGYFSQHTQLFDEEERVIDCVKNVAEYIKTEKGMTSASQMCERFLFSPEIQYNPIGKLSGGELRRLYLLMILMAAPNVLVLDEPTNDLDIPTLTILEDYLDSFEGIVIVVSHDRYFLDRVVDRIFAFEGQGMITQYEGDYSIYMEKAISKGVFFDGVHNDSLYQKEKKPESKDTWKVKEKKLKFTYQEQKEYETIDDDVAVLEGQIEEIDARMADVSSDYTKLQELAEEKEQLSEALDQKMERWIYLNDLADKIKKQND